MSEQDVDTLRRTYEAFNRGDLDEVFKAFDPQIEWHELEGNPQAAGLFRGTDAVANEVFATVPEHWEEFEADPHDFIDAGEHSWSPATSADDRRGMAGPSTPTSPTSRECATARPSTSPTTPTPWPGPGHGKGLVGRAPLPPRGQEAARRDPRPLRHHRRG